MSRVLRSSLVGLAILMMSTFSNPGSQAHSALISSDPKAGSTLALFPESITLVFNEELLTLGGSRSNYLELLSPSSELIELGESAVIGERLTAKVLNDDPNPGSFTLLYRVVSNDGHVIRGEYQFNFRPGSDVDASDGTSVEVIEEVQERANRNSILVLSILIGLALLSATFIYRSAKQSS